MVTWKWGGRNGGRKLEVKVEVKMEVEMDAPILQPIYTGRRRKMLRENPWTNLREIPFEVMQ